MNEPAAVAPLPDVSTGPHDHQRQGILKLAVGAIGIVFGDIGTSPIYAFRETFAGHHPIAPDPLHIHGVLSLIFWSMMIVVTIKYVGVIMRADNKGEGGSLALLALISRKIPERRWTAGIVLLGVFACALFYGDSMITPAISVLSAVEGLQTVEPRFGPFVVPIAVIILVGLFSIQSHGTRRVGTFFGPIMLVYFAAISVFGIMHIAGDPAIVLHTLNPLNALDFFLTDGLARVSRHGLGRAGRDRGRGAVCRHGAFRPQADLAFLARLRDARLDAELHGPGRDDPVAGCGRRGAGGQEPLLPARPRGRATPPHHPRHPRHHHRQPGGHLRRLLGHPAGDPSRLHPAAQDLPHERGGGGADLHSDHQLGADGDGDPARPGFQELVQPRRRLWHRGDRGDVHRRLPAGGGPVLAVEMAGLGRRPAAGALLRRRHGLSRREPS